MKKLNKEEKFVAIILIIVSIGTLFVAYGNWLEKKVRTEMLEQFEARENVIRHETIKDAVLVESNNERYVLSFDGEEYIYYS